MTTVSGNCMLPAAERIGWRRIWYGTGLPYVERLEPAVTTGMTRSPRSLK